MDDPALKDHLAWVRGGGLTGWLKGLEDDLANTEAELVSAQNRISELEKELGEAQDSLEAEEEKREEAEEALEEVEEVSETDIDRLVVWGLEAGARREDVQLASMEASESLREANLRQQAVPRTRGCWHTNTTSDTGRMWCVDCDLTRYFTTNLADKAALVQAAGKILAKGNGGVKVPAPPQPASQPPRNNPRAVAMEGFDD